MLEITHPSASKGLALYSMPNKNVDIPQCKLLAIKLWPYLALLSGSARLWPIHASLNPVLWFLQFTFTLTSKFNQKLQENFITPTYMY
jgi:hypothetical protein